MRLRQISEERESLVNGEIASPVSLVKRRFSIPKIIKSSGGFCTSTENFCLSGFTSNKSFS